MRQIYDNGQSHVICQYFVYELSLVAVIKGSVPAFYAFTLHGAFLRATASRLDALFQLPIARRSAAHFNVIVLSRRIGAHDTCPAVLSRHRVAP
jgi:hypothetical protein